MSYIKADIRDFHPTQITVGMKEVEKKRKHLESLSHDERHAFLEEHLVPVVIGPMKKYYIIDHHHLVLALEQANHEHVYCKIVKDISDLSVKVFWRKMDQARWIHPYDENGKKRPISNIPKLVKDLRDDPYRSLAAFVREQQVYKKTFAPYAEFEWANFFRKHISKEFVEEDFDKAIFVAMGLADSNEAKHISGWTGKMITEEDEKK